MNILQDDPIGIPEEQRAIRAKCIHPTGTFIPFPTEAIDQSIPELFEKQARAYPNRLAVRTRHHVFTYDELNRAANRLAHAIVGQHGRKEENVALLLEHGALQIVAILGVLKAGRVYVPLDPSYPRKRLAYMLEDSQAKLLLTNQTNRSLADALAQNVPVIDISVLDSISSAENLGLPYSQGSLAFILYTSGSTGAPKGFSQTHCNVVHDTRNYTNTGHFCSDDRLLLVSSISFADSVRTIYSALLNGASLYPFDIRIEGLTSLANWLIQNEITIYRSVPTVFRHFASTLTCEERFPKIRLIYLAGEPVYKKDVELYRKHFSEDCIFVNRLGTGEALTFRWYFIDKKTPIKGTHVPVGYAVPDKEVVLLGDVQQGADGSRIGEIAVKSEYLAPGYWKKIDLTQTVFLPDPEGGKSRIYRTGDLGRMLPDGCLVHLGRKDFQMKIRGYRIEIAEIEMALLDHVAIEEAVVRLWESRPGDQRLVAYLVHTGQKGLTVTELRRFLKEALPTYMIPSTFVMLDHLPLTPNGKLDRRALPAPDRVRPALDNPYVAPRTPMEETLAEIWARVLDLDQIGINDNFFELGGHSLLATQVISRVINTFRVKVPLRSLFQAPTVADMAVVIVQNQVEKAESKDIDHMLTELETLSDEEARRVLGDKSVKGVNRDERS
jgi:amino acid adenylation domain-containing protein